MTVSTNASAQCPRCRVLRMPLNMGSWCETCGWNPEYERLLQDLRSALAAKELRCPAIQYDGVVHEEDGSWVRLRLSRDEWNRWVHRETQPA